jgi:hypothetical protein
MVTSIGYAYPWDLDGDPQAAGRVRATGVDAVALAATYHATRAATPLHPTRRLIEAAHAACYLPVRAEVWRGRRLAPLTPAWLPGPDSFGRARDRLRLPVHAWTVLTHNSALGLANPDLTVRNAFGDRYPYALCPAAEEVADYAETLVDEVVRLGQAAGIVLEACGPLGIDHGGHHDKTEFADWTPAQRQLLSLCFCQACRSAHTRVGLDTEEIAARVRAGCGPEAISVEQALGAETAAALRAVRTGTVFAFRHRMIAQARAAQPGIHITVHGSPDPWATGAFPTLADDPAPGADTLVANAWAGPERAEAAIRATVALGGTGSRVGAYLRHDALGTGSPEHLVSRLRDFGVSEFHLYHLGLAPQAGLDLFGRLTTAARTAR